MRIHDIRDGRVYEVPDDIKGVSATTRYIDAIKLTGAKYDQDKPHMNLLLQEVPNALVEVAKALRMGEEKYGRGNWRVVENKEDRYLAALMRHLVAIHQGEKKDPESGLSHLAHVAVNALFLLDSEKHQ